MTFWARFPESVVSDESMSSKPDDSTEGPNAASMNASSVWSVGTMRTFTFSAKASSWPSGDLKRTSPSGSSKDQSDVYCMEKNSPSYVFNDSEEEGWEF